VLLEAKGRTEISNKTAGNLIYFGKFCLQNRGLGRCHCIDLIGSLCVCVNCSECIVMELGRYFMLNITLLLRLSSLLLPWIYHFAIGCTPTGAPWPVFRSVAPVRLNWRARIEYRVECHASSVYPRSKSLPDSADRTLDAPFHPRSPEIRSGRGNKERNLPFRKRTTIRALPFCSVLTVLTDNDLSGSWICGLGP
jgi:hypothetical protein